MWFFAKLLLQIAKKVQNSITNELQPVNPTDNPLTSIPDYINHLNLVAEWRNPHGHTPESLQRKVFQYEWRLLYCSSKGDDLLWNEVFNK